MKAKLEMRRKTLVSALMVLFVVSIIPVLAGVDPIEGGVDLTVTVVVPLIADAGGPYSCTEGSSVTFDGGGSTGSIVSYSWEFGDRGTGTGPTPSHTYTAAGEYTVTLTVTDDDDLIASDTTTVIVTSKIISSPARGALNIKPTADAGPDQTVDVAQMVEFSGANSTDPDGYLTSWTWDFGDGAEASGETASHTYSEPGDYIVKLTVVDVRDGEDTDTCTITVKEHAIPTPPVSPFLDNLTVTPSELELGDNVTIGLDIMNPNDGAIGYGFDMEIGELILNIWVDLEAYESKIVSRTITPTAIGTYNVTVHGMTGNFTVEAPEIPPTPAKFEVTDILITPKEVEPGDEVTISVLVTNIGEETGDYTVTLDCEDLPAGPYLRVQETVTLEGGESERVEFEVSRDIEGTYTVTVDGLTDSFEVKAPLEPEPPEPAKFVFSNLNMIPDENLTITISVNATNDGEETGNYTVRLKLNTVVIDSEEVTLEGGESITTSFEVTRDAGTYTVEVEGLTGTFTIAPTEEQPFWWTSPGYVAGIVIVVTSAGAVIYYIWKGKLLSTIFSNPK